MSRFWLHMVYQMQSLFSKVRTFVFVADMAEVTQFFEGNSVWTDSGSSVSQARSRCRLRQRRLRQAAEQFRNEYLPALNHRTTLVIPGVGTQQRQTAQRGGAGGEINVRQTVWITPEPKWGWTLGSCDMPL